MGWSEWVELRFHAELITCFVERFLKLHRDVDTVADRLDEADIYLAADLLEGDVFAGSQVALSFAVEDFLPLDPAARDEVSIKRRDRDSSLPQCVAGRNRGDQLQNDHCKL